MMNREDFEKAISFIRDEYDKTKRLYDTLSTMRIDVDDDYYGVEAAIKVLTLAMNDKHGRIIEFVYDYDFGRTTNVFNMTNYVIEDVYDDICRDQEVNEIA